MMFDSIRLCLKNAVEQYHDGKRTEWMLKHSGQCVLNGSQVWWTTEVEEAIRLENGQTLQKYLDQLQAQLLDAVQLVRGKLTKL